MPGDASSVRPLRWPVALSLCLLLALAPAASALNEFSYDLRLVRVLGRVGMLDYASLQVERMLTLYPDKADLIHIEQARVYYEDGKRRQGDEALASIKTSSPYYAGSRLLKAKIAERRNPADARKAYTEYFSQVKKPATSDPVDVEPFVEAVRTYAQLMVRDGDGRGAAKALGMLAGLEGDDVPGESQLEFLKGQSIMAAADVLAEQRKDIDTKLVASSITSLVKLQWKDSNYGLIASALIEAAHGFILLDNYDKALETLGSISEILGAIDRATENKSESPLAGAFYYYGRAIKGQAGQAFKKDDRDAAKDLLIKALKRFRKVSKDYEESSYARRALLEEGKIRALLEQEFGIKFGDSTGSDSRNIVILQQADRLLEARDFSAATDLYLQALRNSRLGRKSPETAMRLVYCYGQDGNFLAAQAIASFLGEVFPDRQETADALLQLGALLFQRSQAEQKAERKEALIAEAMAVWDLFVEVAPEHDNAPEIAFAVAENEYRKASLVARQSGEAPGKARKEELKAEARELFKQAVPKYERVINVFGVTPKGTRALYKLGWIYYSLEGEPHKAADAFLQYSLRETDPKHAHDRLEAKFRAAEQLMFSDTPAEAIPHFKELLTWTAPDNPQGFDPSADVALRLREDSTSYLPWSYDLAAEALRPAITAIDDEIQRRDDELAAGVTSLAGLREREAAAQQMIQAADIEYAENAAAAEAPLPVPEEKALAEVMPKDEQLADLTPEERDIELRNKRQEAQRHADAYRKSLQQQYEGERQGLDAEKARVFEERTAMQKELADLQASQKAAAAVSSKLVRDLESAVARLAALTTGVEEARNAVAQLEQESEKWRQQFEQAKELFATGDDKQKVNARTLGAEARDGLKASARALRKARDDLDRVDTEESRRERKVAARENARLQREADTLKAAADVRARRSELLEHRVALSEARLQAVAQRLAMNELATELLALPPEQRQATEKEKGLGDKRATVLNALQEVKEKQIELGVFEQTGARENIAKVEQAAAQAKAGTAALQAERAPLQSELLAHKKQAQQFFEAFLKAYPASRHVPENMARIGTIFIEFQDYKNAARYLEELAEKFPGTKAVKQALFSLGKVQYETKKTAEAVGTFRKILSSAEEQSTGSLNYIMRAMSEAGQPDVAVSAGRELLRRSEDPDHEDYDLLAGKTRENLMFRMGSAAYEGGDHKAAIKLLDQLLKENDKTAHYFRAHMILGKAQRERPAPDLMAARRHFNEVRQFAQDQVLRNQAILELAHTFLAQENEAGCRKALAQIGQMVLVTEAELIVLLDAADPAMSPVLEEAMYIAATCHALLGNAPARDLIVKGYRERFPHGTFTEQISRLPATTYKRVSAGPAGGGSATQ